MKIMLNILVSSLAVVLTARLIPGIKIDNFGAAILVAVILGLLNALLAPTLARLTLSVNPLTLGLVTFSVIGILVLLTARVVPGFHVAGFRWALAFAVVLSAINTLFHWSDVAGTPPAKSLPHRP